MGTMSEAVGLTGQLFDTPLVTKVAANETLSQVGVIKLKRGLSDYMYMRRTPGIVARLDPLDRLNLRISVVADWGVDVCELGVRIQEAVYRGIERTSDLQVGKIHVTIAGVERLRRGNSTEEEVNS